MDNRVFDYTLLDIFQTCRKKYYFYNVLHLKPRRKSPALLWGSHLHDSLDIHYTEGNEKAIAHWDSFEDIEGETLRTREIGKKVLEWYGKVYPTEPFTLIRKPEEGFVYPIGDVLYGGRMDLPVEWDDCAWVVEHKSTSMLGPTFFKQFELDKQVIGYIVATEEYLGRKCQGAVINAIQPWKELKKPTSKSKRPEERFVRCPITVSQAVKDRFKLNVQRLVRDIRWCEENDEFYEAEKKNCCFYYNYDCPYKQLCMFGEDKGIMERDFRIEKWEPYKLEENNNE